MGACIHKFHRECMVNYFKEALQKNCPNCRTQLNRADYNLSILPTNNTTCKQLLACTSYLLYVGTLIAAFSGNTLVFWPMMSMVLFFMGHIFHLIEYMGCVGKLLIIA